jgi:hypothetical protein
MLATLSFLVDSWAQFSKQRGIVIWDRHELDALVALAYVHTGSSSSISHRMVKRLLPRPHKSYYVKVDGDIAAARQSGEVLSAFAMHTQVEGRQLLLSNVTVIDGRLALEELSNQVLRDLLFD